MATSRKAKKELLRQKAEKLLSKTSPVISMIGDKDIKKLVQELQVHQIELEMQNEELRRAQADIEESRIKYSDLYDFAPVGYFSFRRSGEIAEVNLTGAALFGMERSLLRHRPFSALVDPGFRKVFRDHRLNVLKNGKKEHCELKLIRKDGTPFYAYLESVSAQVGKTTWIRSAVLDMTDLKKAREQAESEHAFRMAIENSILSGIAAIDLEGRQSYVNLGFCRMVGRSEEELIGRKPPFPYWPPEESENISRAFHKIMSGKAPPEGVQLRFMRKIGERFDVLVLASRLKDSTGKVIGWIGTFGDITHLRRIENDLKQLNAQLEERVHQRTIQLEVANEELGESETKFRIIADNTYDMEFWEDPEGRFVFMSPSCKRITGHDASEFMEDPNLLRKIVHPEDLASFDRHRREEEKEVPLQEIEFRIIHADGSIRWISHVCQRIFNDQGRFLGIRASNRGITRRKHAEEALRESRERYRSLATNLPSVIMRYGKDLRVLFLSPKAEEITGVPIQKFIGRTNREARMPDHLRVLWDNAIQEVFRTGTSKDLEFDFQSQKRTKTFYLMFAPEFGPGGEVRNVLGIATDITERKQMEEELKRSLHQLELRVQERTAELIEAVTELQDETSERKRTEESLRIIAHELKDRVREVNCLYSVCYYVEKPYGKFGERLQSIVNLLPSGWQYPEMTCARITLQDEEYKSGNFNQTPWKQVGNIIVHEEPVGTVEIYYLEEKPERDEGPFSKEERQLINAIAVELGEMIAHEQADEAVRRQADQLATMLTTTTDGFWVHHTDGKLLDVNEAYCRMSGYSRDELLRLHISDIDAVETPGQTVRHIRKIMETGFDRFETKHRRKDGEVFDVEISASFRPQLGQFLVFARDVSERKRAEAALQAAHQYNRSLIEASLDPLVTINADGKITDVNRATETVTGLSRDRLIGSDFSDYFTEPEKAENGYLQAFLSGSVKDYPLAIRHTSGKISDVLYNATVYKNKAGEVQGVYAAARDITERKKAEQALQDSEMRLRYLSSQLLTVQENERKSIARELHDGVGQLLTAVKFKIESTLQLRSKKKSLEAVVPLLRESIDEVRRVQMDLRPSTLDDLGVLATLEWFFREYQKIYSHIRIEKQIGIQETEVPVAVKTVIYRVTQEALNNIAKHSQANLVRFSLIKTEEGIELTIRDDGMGFDLEQVIAKEGSKRGLGLTSMRERIQLSGGSCMIESALRQGTTLKGIWPI